MIYFKKYDTVLLEEGASIIRSEYVGQEMWAMSTIISGEVDGEVRMIT
jgi:hypothetical protein